MDGIWLFFTDKRMFCIGFLAKMQTCPQFEALLLQVYIQVLISGATIYAWLSCVRCATIYAWTTLVIHKICG